MRNRNYGSVLAALWIVFISAAAVSDAAASDGRIKRPMQINRVHELGLEIWTERSPQWETRTEAHPKGKSVFIAEAPGLVYPPAGMTWAIPGVQVGKNEMREAARGALFQAALNYGVTETAARSIKLHDARYGSLEGYEAQFTAHMQGTPVDVKVFFGHQSGKPAVAMQAFTLKGKLPHISEQIRRSWSNVRYLSSTDRDAKR